MKLKNKTILITGASKGLGKAMAHAFAQNGADLILTARSQELLTKVKNDIQTRTGSAPLIIPCDVSSEEDVEKMGQIIKDSYQRVDILVNNAGFGTFTQSEQMSNPDMRRHFEVNFFGTYYCIKALLPLIKASPSGYILNIGSFFSRLARMDNSVYAATKFALDGFSKGLRQELRPLNIKVGLYVPGPIDTAFHDNRKDPSVQTSKSIMMRPEKAVKKIGQMIQKRQKEKVHPVWMYQALKLQLALSFFK